MEENSNMWKEELIKIIFYSDEAKAVCNIPSSWWGIETS